MYAREGKVERRKSSMWVGFGESFQFLCALLAFSRAFIPLFPFPSTVCHEGPEGNSLICSRQVCTAEHGMVYIVLSWMAMLRVLLPISNLPCSKSGCQQVWAWVVKRATSISLQVFVLPSRVLPLLIAFSRLFIPSFPYPFQFSI